MLLGGLCVSVYFAPSFALAQNLVEPRMRASAAALVLLAMNVLGQGVGPLLMGLVSDVAAGRAFVSGDYRTVCLGAPAAGGPAADCARASAEGLQHAIIGAVVFFAWGALHYMLAARSVTHDLRRARP
jgi:MFS family permease